MSEAETELLFDYESIIDTVLNNDTIPTESQIRDLLQRTKKLLLAEPPLIRVSSDKPIIISGITTFLSICNLQRRFLR